MPLKASSALGALFLSGWNCSASFRYWRFRPASSTSRDTPRIS